MGSPGFNVRLDTTGGDVACLFVTGEIDLATQDHLHGAIKLALEAVQLSELVIDLGAVTFCDSSGLGVLVNARRACQQRGVSLILHRPDERLRKTMKVAGLTDHFTIEPVTLGPFPVAPPASCGAD